MLDVHPPHHPTHTWRDFFIHIATIVVGLLIAVCLEQGVEAIHRHHERQQLIEDLRQEAEGRNHVIRENNQAYAQFEDWLRECLRAALSATPSDGRVTRNRRPPCGLQRNPPASSRFSAAEKLKAGNASTILLSYHRETLKPCGLNCDRLKPLPITSAHSSLQALLSG
jgi:predicted secreted protein